MDHPVLARTVRRRIDRRADGAATRPRRLAGTDKNGTERLAGRVVFDGGHARLHSGAATDQRIQRRHHHRDGSDILGIALAIFMALAIAAMTVMVRRHKDTSMVAAAAMSNLLGSVVSLPFAHGLFSVSGPDLFILAMFG